MIYENVNVKNEKFKKNRKFITVQNMF